MGAVIMQSHRRRCKSKNSQAKGLDSDDTLESNGAPKKQPVAIGNLSGKATEAQKR